MAGKHGNKFQGECKHVLGRIIKMGIATNFEAIK